MSAGTFEIPARKYGGRVLFRLSDVLQFIDSLPVIGEVSERTEDC
jgi:hypothetical protein